LLYKEIGSIFNKAITNPAPPTSPQLLHPDEIKDMENIGEDRLTLAFIGDAVLRLGAIISIWDRDCPTIPSKGGLDKERNRLVQNKPLSKLWDSLEIYDKKILIQSSEENIKTKGSSMEAVFGIIYLEGGLAAIERSMNVLQRYYKQKQLRKKRRRQQSS
jgi:dsRNA-specific ribonuclease